MSEEGMGSEWGRIPINHSWMWVRPFGIERSVSNRPHIGSAFEHTVKGVHLVQTRHYHVASTVPPFLVDIPKYL